MDAIQEKANALFAEHDAPTHATKQDVHDQLGPIMRVVAAVRKQVLEYQVLIQEMEQAAPDPRVYPILEHLHQTFGAIERNAALFATAGRQLSLDFVQLDRYMGDAKADVERREQEAAEAKAAEASVTESAVPGAPVVAEEPG